MRGIALLCDDLLLELVGRGGKPILSRLSALTATFCSLLMIDQSRTSLIVLPQPLHTSSPTLWVQRPMHGFESGLFGRKTLNALSPGIV